MHISDRIMPWLEYGCKASEAMHKIIGCSLHEDLIAVALITASTIAFILFPPLASLPARIPIGLAMIYFLPGYALIAALFPSRDDLDFIERAALSIGLSITIIPITGIFLDNTPWGIRLAPVVISLCIFTLILSGLAWIRRTSLEEDRRLSINLKESIQRFKVWLEEENSSKRDRVLTIALILLLIASTLSLAYVTLTPSQGEKFTEFYILGPGGMACNYPGWVVIGENSTVIAGIANHEYRTVNYTIVVSLNNTTLAKRDIKLDHNQVWKSPVTYELKIRPREEKRINLTLYEDSNLTTAYRQLHIWSRSMHPKKVIIRNDDVDKVDPVLLWLSDIVMKKDISITYSVIPKYILLHPGIIEYLNGLDKDHFELATHGYGHVGEEFSRMSYERQVDLISNGTRIMEEAFHKRPYTFVPPFIESSNITEKICMDLGYHTLSTPRFEDINFNWESYRPEGIFYHRFQDFKDRFDAFYNSYDEFFIIMMHHPVWFNKTTGINETVCKDFEKSIDYMKSKDVDFITSEQMYQLNNAVKAENHTITSRLK